MENEQTAVSEAFLIEDGISREDLEPIIQARIASGSGLRLQWKVLGKVWEFHMDKPTDAAYGAYEVVQAQNRARMQIACVALGLMRPYHGGDGKRLLTTEERREKIEQIFSFCENRDQ